MEQLEILHKASDLINKATRVLFLTSAGMSADSNIPTFRDKNGYWRNFPPSLMKGTGSSTNGSKTGMDSSTLLIPMVCI